MGAKGTLEYNMAKMIGTGADALVQGLSEEQFQQLKENSMFEKVGCWVPIEIMTNTNRIFAEIDYADQPQLELRMQTPRTGSAPQKANEVLVSANILKDLNIEEKSGQKFLSNLRIVKAARCIILIWSYQVFTIHQMKNRNQSLFPKPSWKKIQR